MKTSTLVLFLLAFVSSYAHATPPQVYHVCADSGTDVGAQINSADAAAGSSPADIWVECAGTVLTVPTIRSAHRLFLAAPLTWTVGLTLNSNTQVFGTGQKAIQQVNLNSNWIGAIGTNNSWVPLSSLSDLTIEDLWVNNTMPGASMAATVLNCHACKGITMRNNHAMGIGLITTNTTEAHYSQVTASTLSYNITLSDNVVDGNSSFNKGHGNQVILAYLLYTQHVVATNNAAYNAMFNLEWWGGNPASDGLTLSNPRWASDIIVTGGLAHNVRAGFWGAMGQDITVSGVKVDTCNDVGIDAEGSRRVMFFDFTVENCANGGLAVFFLCQQVKFGPGTVISGTASNALLWAHNPTADPTRAFDLLIHDTKFLCNDPSKLCNLYADPIGSFQFHDNTITNAVLKFVQSNNSGYDISRNTFTYTYTPATPFNAITVPGQVHNYLPGSIISSNTFQSTAPAAQQAGTYAIKAVINDYNHSDVLCVAGNTTSGFTNDARFEANSRNSGIAPTFIFGNNTWGANSVARVTTGARGTFKNRDFRTPPESSSNCR
jgi:hypothetical protein